MEPDRDTLARPAVNVCSDGGWLVDARPLPDDPHDHDADGLPIRGCTRLGCGLCQQPVRSGAGLRLVASGRNVDPGALYRTPDLATSRFVEPSARTRLYTCACLSHVEASEHPLVDVVDPSSAIPPARQWSCAGHPIVRLPHPFDGWEVRPDELAALVDRALAGELPARAAEVDRLRARWLARLAARLAGTPHAEALAKAVALRLTDDDVAVRVRAVHFFVHARAQRHAMPLASLLSEHAHAFVGVVNPHADGRADRTLEHLLWWLAGGVLASDPALRQMARDVAADPARASYAVVRALADGDPTWLTANAEQLARAHPAGVDDLVRACRHMAGGRRIVERLNALTKG